ncbi:MAG: hypothetical protein HYX80_03720 [Chloroflexi bacterium]|nr:hypothetical protein [Chloroflexota bacterium]
MATNDFGKLMEIIVGKWFGRVEVIKRLLTKLDLLEDSERMVAQLYLNLSPAQQSQVKLIVQAALDTKKIQNSPLTHENLGEVAKVGEITVSDVHRNEQVNIVALCRGLQTILCCALDFEKYYALVPQKGDSDKYKLSLDGEAYQKQIRREYGSELERFPRIYVSRVYASVTLTNNTVKFWEDVKNADLFKYWDPEHGPYKWEKRARPRVQMLRVFKVNCNLAPHIAQNDAVVKHPLFWIGDPVHCQVTPVLTDGEMNEHLEKFNEVLKTYRNPRAEKVS